MIEREIQELLNATADFVQRQRLLKQLWHLQRQREIEAATSGSAQRRQSSPPIQYITSQRAKTLVA